MLKTTDYGGSSTILSSAMAVFMMFIKKKYRKIVFRADFSIFEYFLAAKLRHLSSRSLIVGQELVYISDSCHGR